MGKSKIYPWAKLCCSQCGTEEQATRGHADHIDIHKWLCSDCALTKPLEEENTQLRAEVERLRSAARDVLAWAVDGSRLEGDPDVSCRLCLESMVDTDGHDVRCPVPALDALTREGGEGS